MTAKPFSGVRPHKCEICGKCCSNRVTLIKHIDELHDGNKSVFFLLTRT